MRRAILITVVTLVVALGTALAIALLWTPGGSGGADAAGTGGEMSLDGWMALGLGALGVALLAGILMGLVFYSHRHGHDQ